MKTPKNKQSVKARLVRANNQLPSGRHDPTFDHYELPATQEAYDAMREQMAEAFAIESRKRVWDTPTALLRSIGITPPTK